MYVAKKYEGRHKFSKKDEKPSSHIIIINEEENEMKSK